MLNRQCGPMLNSRCRFDTTAFARIADIQLIAIKARTGLKTCLPRPDHRALVPAQRSQESASLSPGPLGGC